MTLRISIVLILVVVNIYVYGQTVLNNVRVIDHRQYMVDVISETVREVERREWCNLKLLDVTQDLDEEVLNWHLDGTVVYKNGFAVTIQHVNILQSSLNQIWSTVGDGTVRVEVRGQLRLIDVSLGFDVDVQLTDGHHHYTGIITHPIITFDFSIFRNAHTHDMSVTVVGTQARTTNIIRILPIDKISDALSTLFDSNSTYDGVGNWGSEVFQPIALDVLTNRVAYPGLCYNCAVT